MFFSSPKHLDWLKGPSSLYSLQARVLSMGGKQPGRNVGHSPPSSAKVKNEWSCNYTLRIYICGMHRNNFTLSN